MGFVKQGGREKKGSWGIKLESLWAWERRSSDKKIYMEFGKQKGHFNFRAQLFSCKSASTISIILKIFHKAKSHSQVIVPKVDPTSDPTVPIPSTSAAVRIMPRVAWFHVLRMNDSVMMVGPPRVNSRLGFSFELDLDRLDDGLKAYD
ncbi:glycine--tRNA ligase alpha subunit [Striga asiatica]|uniref:Glycine--tRNA ligase alpha subunit n=1 Tax=Striga asiatica TaxID=4170 RepID=A0A5A7QFA1_STRAF|nr:glycine--tRNA ligase alpha subunit [Striga asiatica]